MQSLPNEKGEKVEISDSQRYKMLGNSVTTSVIEAIMNRIITTKSEKEEGR